MSQIAGEVGCKFRGGLPCSHGGRHLHCAAAQLGCVRFGGEEHYPWDRSVDEARPKWSSVDTGCWSFPVYVFRNSTERQFIAIMLG